MKKLISAASGAIIVLFSLGMSTPPASAATTITWPPPGPVMGFNTWYQFRTNITENLILQQAQELVSSGWPRRVTSRSTCTRLEAANRTAAGEYVNAVKFPHGIPRLVNQVHGLGLKFGIYTAIGTRTCQNLPGSWSHYNQDALTFAQWGVDFVKVDECGGLPAGTTASTLTDDFLGSGPTCGQLAHRSYTARNCPSTRWASQDSLIPSSRRPVSRICGAWTGTRISSNPRPTPSFSISRRTFTCSDRGALSWNHLDMIRPGQQAAMPFRLACKISRVSRRSTG